jgi:hypothetical protein
MIKKISGGRSDNVIDLIIDTCHKAIAAPFAALQKAQDMGISIE